ncbi:MAG: hypothetical protein CMM81_16185 [Rhodospirillales bacterium]|jgi:hypothetical protein|uniref:hypothetical protein n=1 Tax=Hwanghaeella sp. 1Z406 TaxID=3402811 RepID=UPI000C95E07B|nr:hypothetical protein [Rhodospirillales bacterium]|tara:strand:- start:94 stop:519 length:426 start_codon:yes stop_codon:yes gene_type:complete
MLSHQFHSIRQLVVRIILAMALIGLAACDATRLFTPTSTEFDGAWVGQLSVSLRTEDCYIARGGLRVKVENGQLYGELRLPLGRGNFTGTVAEDGTVAGIKLTGVQGATDAEFTGTFQKNTAQGEWTHKYCRGEWELKKLR